MNPDDAIDYLKECWMDGEQAASEGMSIDEILAFYKDSHPIVIAEVRKGYEWGLANPEPVNVGTTDAF